MRAAPIPCGLATLLFPALLRAAGLAPDALSTFPDDTQQLAYTNLAEVRASRAYGQIRERLLTPEFRDFLDFLRPFGIDAEKDVDEVVLGWRGSPSDTANFFGLASGRFQPEQARQVLAREHLPSREYGGVDLYSSGSRRGSADFFFGFLSPYWAVFGRLNDLTALLDARSGVRLALDTNSKMVSWETELEGSAAQWGIMRGRAAANMAARWLTSKLPFDPSTALGPVQAVLYRVDWDGGFTAGFSILCESAQTAAALTQVLTLLRDSQTVPAATGTASGSTPSLSHIDVETSGSRVELSASGPLEALDTLLTVTH